MRNFFTSIAVVCLLAFVVTSCKKEIQEPGNEVSESELADIKALGFGTQNVQKIGRLSGRR